jgi:hypothetical protein
VFLAEQRPGQFLDGRFLVARRVSSVSMRSARFLSVIASSCRSVRRRPALSRKNAYQCSISHIRQVPVGDLSLLRGYGARTCGVITMMQ